MLIWLVGGGIILTVRLGFIQFTKLGFILKHTIGKSFSGKGDKGMISGFKAVTGALASTLGAGNIVGTAMAIAYGGPGGVFWLWLTGLVACAIKYSEVTLAMKYRHKDKNGNWEGGPQYYLGKCTGQKWLGVAYAISCAFCLFLAASAQVGAGVDNMVALGAPRTITTAIEIVIIALIVLGGLKRFLDVSEKVVPLMSVLYMAGGLIVIFMNIQNLPGALYSIFRYAFTGRAAFGGFAGATVTMCIRWGVCRGIYSNDAGTGCTTIAHSATDEANHPVQQGMWGVFEVFFDTIIVCSITCLSILCTGVWEVNGTAATLTANAFSNTMGSVGGYLVTVSLVLFTFTTACAQVEFGSSQLKKLLGDRAYFPTKVVYLVALFGGGIIGINALINYVDFGSFLMIFFNMIGVYWCHKQVVELTKEYFADPKKWETEKWPEWVKEEQNYLARK
ncbi:MAG: amino acid carrier protein [Lawsonibacter sp.]|nr:amino acid carrier protein [Lawsonibacter sp.]